MGRGAVYCLIALAVLVPAAGRAQTPGGGDPAGAVFQLDTIDRTTGNGMGYGTAFFTAADGTALTVSHVVYRAVQDPERYALLAVVDKEFYSARIVCASRLGYDPTKTGIIGVRLGRDVAEIKIVPSEFAFSDWFFPLKTGEKLTLATAHRDAVPAFRYLTLAAGPVQGDHIRVIGYGHISPLPRMFVADGHIAQLDRAWDGTDIFSALFTSRPQPGNSGSPILNDHNEVVGIVPWTSLSQSNEAMGISSSALQRPCR
jgi:V8-like Glu-specific endopeptidase